MANNRELSQLASLIVVDDTTRNIGIATTGFSNVGIGTTNPVTPLHISDGNGGISTALYTSDYLTISAQNTPPGFNIIAASSSSSGHRGVFKATRSRGTLSSPTVPLVNDNVFSLLGNIYDGSAGRATAAINMDVDGDVGLGTAPQRITFWTGTGSSRLERARIQSTGEVLIGSATSTGTASQPLQVTGGAYVSGSVGIGTTNPGAQLHVVPAASSIAGLFSGTTSSDMVRITQLGTGNALVIEDDTNPDATPFVINASGNVGIGTTNPSQALDIYSAGPVIRLTDSDDNSYSRLRYNRTANAGSLILEADALNQNPDVTDISFRVGGTTSDDEKASISSSKFTVGLGGTVLTANLSGSVGIGTTNPGNAFNFSGITSTTTKLDVRGKTLLFYDGDVSTGATSKSDMDTKSILKLRGTTNSSANMQFATMAATTAMGIQVTNQANTADLDLLLNPFGGNIGIGTTNPTSKLHVVGNVLVTGITTSTDFNSSSDINLKDNVQRIENPIDKVLQLDGVTFNWKKTNRPSVGVVAQQVERVLPQLVSGDQTKTVNYNGLIALLIECVKEQQIEINNLKEKLK